MLHDWTLDCRTNGTGVTREHSLAELKALDIGHGYTADGGKTYPLRGKGVGLMPTLDEVLARFPDKRFLINIKSNDPADGDMLAARLASLAAEQRALLAVYGGERPVRRLQARLPATPVMSQDSLKRCLLRYMALGWTGYVPEACRKSIILLPINIAPWVWGYPHRLIARMEAAGSPVFVAGRYDGTGFSSGVDDLATFARLPAGFGGGVWTNRIERIGQAAMLARVHTLPRAGDGSPHATSRFFGDTRCTGSERRAIRRRIRASAGPCLTVSSSPAVPATFSLMLFCNVTARRI